MTLLIWEVIPKQHKLQGRGRKWRLVPVGVVVVVVVVCR